MILKMLNFIIGILIIFIGSIFINITVYNETMKTMTYKGFGFFMMIVGILYLKNFAKMGKQ
ncbi:Uncharacterised protein [Lysinibacillus sphaericus]|uniref:Uncharacterized protein n=1 Tax=Lysinibacillus sphaericus TaxID=1421 RepID=A0A2S0K0U3_LYSSH|nr:hypothetical protein LS41612_11645 [Lysinibacillus sphaericus]GEC81733.1 hypothetical protein LSP03_14760 [Lysinibacillus sphaericus]SUV17297.1 Uncharacterised protein [Lysinibacillus sphaericus]